MTTLKESRDYILSAKEPAVLIQQADNLLYAFEAQRDQFELPRSQLLFLPILEYYVDNLEGWVKFIAGVRDRLPPRSDERREVQELHRKISTRYIQRIRRERITRAVLMAVRVGLIPDTVADRERYGKRCLQFWKKRRLMLMSNLSSASPGKRATREDQEAALEELWQIIDSEIDNGELPKP